MGVYVKLDAWPFATKEEELEKFRVFVF